MKYLARALETEAMQFTGDNWKAILDFVGTHWVDIDYYMDNFIPVEEMWVDIPEGITALIWVEPSKQWAGVKPGDYIVQDADENFYPCEKTIFERKYEPKDKMARLSFTGGTITADAINNAIGHSIQQSRRFQG